MQPEIEITKLEGELNLVNEKLSSISRTVGEMAQSLDEISENVNKNDSVFLTRSEFREFKTRTRPFLGWVKDRMAVEKFFVGAVSLIGVSQVILIVITALELKK